MAQDQDFRTYELYQKYHKLIYNTRDNQTYSYFANVAREMSLNQPDVLIGYIKSLIEDIIKDINTYGDCWLLQAIVNKTLPAIHVLDYSAVLYVYDSVFAPARRQTLNTRNVPYTASLASTPGGLLYRDPRTAGLPLDNRSVSDFDTKCTALLMHARNKMMEAGNKALKTQVAALNDQVAALKDQLQDMQSALVDQASYAFAAEKKKLMEAAEQEAQAIRDEAAGQKAQAEEIMAAARKEREGLAAQLEAIRQQHDDAMQSAEAAHHQKLAEEEASLRKRIVEDVRRESAVVREELRGEFDDYSDAAEFINVRNAVCDTANRMQSEMTAKLEASVATFGQTKDAMVSELETVKGAIAQQLDNFMNRFNTLRIELAQNMDASANAVSATKGEMMQEMQGWRSKLFKQDVGRLANVYASLYTYTNRKLAQDVTQLQMTLDPQKDEKTLSAIKGMQSKCSSLLVSLEAAMRDLGLVVFSPKDNESYDDTMHRALNEELLNDDTSTNIIRTCNVPGVRMAGDDGVVVKKAEVFLAEEN